MPANDWPWCRKSAPTPNDFIRHIIFYGNFWARCLPQNRGCHLTAFFGKLPLWRQKSNPSADHEMKKLTLALVALLATLTLSQAEIGETMKEVLAHGFHFYGWKPIQFHDCPALQSASVTRGTTTLIFSPKTNRQIATIFDSRHRLSAEHVDTPRNRYGQWQVVQDNPKLASWHLKHPRLGDLWMVVTANAHVLIIATPEGLDTVGLHAAKVPREKASTQ